MGSIQMFDIAYALSFIAFFSFEGWALFNKTEGDTFSERLRYYFRVKGKTGSFIFLAAFGFFSAWFAAHIIQIPI